MRLADITDQIVRYALLIAAFLSVIILILIAVFTLIESWDAFTRIGVFDLVFGTTWHPIPDDFDASEFGIPEGKFVANRDGERAGAAAPLSIRIDGCKEGRSGGSRGHCVKHIGWGEAGRHRGHCGRRGQARFYRRGVGSLTCYGHTRRMRICRIAWGGRLGLCRGFMRSSQRAQKDHRHDADSEGGGRHCTANCGPHHGGRNPSREGTRGGRVGSVHDGYRQHLTRGSMTPRFHQAPHG